MKIVLAVIILSFTLGYFFFYDGYKGQGIISKTGRYHIKRTRKRIKI